MLDLTVKNAFMVSKLCLKKRNPDKFEHSKRVANTSIILAKKWGISVEDAVITALLHDVGKTLNRSEMLAFISKEELPLYDFEVFDNLAALHGRVSSAIFETLFSKKDIVRFNSISHAISSHVAGSDYMSDLDKIIFIADNTEPGRNNNILSLIESGELSSIDECIRKIITEKLEKSDEKGRVPNPFLNATLDFLDDER